MAFRRDSESLADEKHGKSSVQTDQEHSEIGKSPRQTSILDIGKIIRATRIIGI